MDQQASKKQDGESLTPASSLLRASTTSTSNDAINDVPYFLRRENVSWRVADYLGDFRGGLTGSLVTHYTYENMLPAFRMANTLFTLSEEIFLKIIDAPVEFQKNREGQTFAIFCQTWQPSERAGDNLKKVITLFEDRVRIVSLVSAKKGNDHNLG